MTGTISATVIQSSPSMKFTRLTNQSPARRAIAKPSPGAQSSGNRPAPSRREADEQRDAGGLQGKARESRHRADIIPGPDEGEEERPARERECGDHARHHIEKGRSAESGRQRPRHHRDTTSLGRGSADDSNAHSAAPAHSAATTACSP